MLPSHIINKAKCSIIGIALLSLSLANAATPANCDKKAFNMQVDSEVTINEVLNQLADVCNFSTISKDVVASKELNKVMNGINIKNKTLRQIFDVLLTENNLNYEYRNNVLKVSSLFTKTFNVDYITSVRQATAIMKSSTSSTSKKTDDGADTSEASDLNDNQISSTESFDFWKTISNEISVVLNNGTEEYVAVAPIVNPNAGLITVTATKSQLARVQKYITDLQKRLKKQVMLDVSIISVEYKNTYSTGIDWSKFQFGFGLDTSYLSNANGEPHFSKAVQTLGNGLWTINSNFNFNMAGMINFLETKGNAKMLSSPKVMTLHNQPALITVGTNLNYLLTKTTTTGTNGQNTSESTEQYTSFVGILLNILPQISDDGRIMLRINPSLSKLLNDNTNVVNGPRRIAPDTKESKLSTVAYVNDGDTVILGGLITQDNVKDNTSVPVLSAIPLIGNLFKSTADNLQSTELVFVITPHIIKPNNKISDDLKQLGYSKSIYEY